ncbi:MAG: right-handed parallel beta-helix repeat-containing protein [Euryarchaeota archaeon]|nr:right-handed parallel beta-helix repeat-containing protein [Euryarchaeota archaeon]
MKSKTLVILLIILLATNCFISFPYIEKCTASVLPKFYVDDDYDSSTPGWQVDHFDEIQDAINKSNGDRIIVYSGTYNEKLTINNKTDLFGENRDTVTINGGGSGDVVTISAQNVNISHFTIKNSGSNENDAVIKVNLGHSIITDNIISGGKQGISIDNNANNLIYDNIVENNDGDGIKLNQSDSNHITYNTVTDNANGMFLYNSSDNTIDNNVVQDNNVNGIFLNETSNNNDIIDNNISENSQNGIYLNDHCNYNTISTNTNTIKIHGNGDSGIRLENSSINTINSNTVNGNTNYGIMIVGSDNIIQGNTISYNEEHGMFLFADDNNTISDNTISGNTHDGIRLYNSTKDSIYRNEISGNSGYGAYLDFFTKSNQVCNNKFYDNTHNACDKSIGQNNSWNISKKTNETNKIGGPHLGGNYWDDYTGPDSDKDGLGDTHYTIYGNNKDKLPLIDVISPIITNVGVSPSSQSLGSYVYISATITDNIEASNVYLVIKYPNTQTVNFSIVQNKTGNTYYCNKIYSSVGTYTFYVTATDARHNWASTSSTQRTFQIQEGVPPTVVDKSPTTGSPSGRYTFNATVTDDKDSASYLTVKVHWSHGKLGKTYYLVNVYENYFEWEIKLDNSTSDLKYYIYASDRWGNSVTTAEKAVKIVDKESPKITINRYGPSFDALPNSYTFDAIITDNHRVSNATIEYWYNDNSHITADMDYKGNNLYEKVIIPEGTPDRVYCIISATDPSGNKNDSKNPFAEINGPYRGFVAKELTFNATGSFDLDGSITDYSWNFDDGATGTGISPKHTYSTNGNYTIKLTVKDNDGKTNTNTTYAVIYPFIQLKTSYAKMNEIKETYNITLDELFYSYDTNGDAVVDTFVDPNDVLKAVHTGYVNISGNIAFLISVNDTSIPEFIWNATTNKIVSIKHTLGIINSTYEENNAAIVNVSLNKTKGWIYLEVLDQYPQGTLVNVKANNTVIPSDRIWRKNGKVYLLDDPEISYQFTYENISPPQVLGAATFVPLTGGLIDENNPTITFSYNVSVRVIYADFYNQNDTREGVGTEDSTLLLNTTDNKNFTCTPPPHLKDGTYVLDIYVEDQDNPVNKRSDRAIYRFVSYSVAEEKTGFSWISIILVGGFAAVGIALLLIMRYKQITFDSFIYIKNKKIIPFFKPVVFGPLSIDVNDARVGKAEFYVDGKLRNTVTEAPYIWEWNESAFMKHIIETKVYDREGNSVSSGEMTFFVFNSPKFFK